MARNKATVYYAKSLNDAIFHMKTVPQLKIFGGCTTVQSLPPASLMIKNIADFSQISRIFLRKSIKSIVKCESKTAFMLKFLMSVF